MLTLQYKVTFLIYCQNFLYARLIPVPRIGETNTAIILAVIIFFFETIYKLEIN